MFTHQHHLKHLLQPEHYTSEAQYQAELRHLFHPAWHPLAAKKELARPGDFLTFHLLETPIIIRNFDGELRAFRNVCPHRHCTLTDQPRGTSQSLRCQYHGWEYAADGHTGKIPDAKAFRPWDRANSCLQPFHLDTCGDLVFVNLSDNPPPLKEWIGPLWDIWKTHDGAIYRHSRTWEKDFPCNWKVVLENSLESYHIPLVHPYTFKQFPDETTSWHELNEKFTTFKTLAPRDWATRMENLMTRLLGMPITNEYYHRVLHPHATGSMLDSFRMMQCVFPTGPHSCRYRCIFFTLRGRRRNPIAWLAYRLLKTVATMVAKQVFKEDAAIYGGVQRGIEASPFPGVIGVREERIYYFQKYVLDTCRGAKELPLLTGENWPEGPTSKPRFADRIGEALDH